MEWVTELPSVPKWMERISDRRLALQRLATEQSQSLATAGLVNVTAEATTFLNRMCGVSFDALVFATEAVMKECVEWEHSDNAAIEHHTVVSKYPGHGSISHPAYVGCRYERLLELLTVVYDLLDGESFDFGDEIDFEFACVQRDGKSVTPATVYLTVSIGERNGARVVSVRKSDE